MPPPLVPPPSASKKVLPTKELQGSNQNCVDGGYGTNGDSANGFQSDEGLQSQLSLSILASKSPESPIRGEKEKGQSHDSQSNETQSTEILPFKVIAEFFFF